MDHFGDITPDMRWRNDLLNEQRKTNKLLEQIAQLLQQKQTEVKQKEPVNRGGRRAIS